LSGNYNIGSEVKKDFWFWFQIGTETRCWTIRECDIRSDGAILNAQLLSKTKRKASRITRLRKEAAFKDE
jgi:hypothetical protein